MVVFRTPVQTARDLAARATARRLERGWTRQEAADRAGIAFSTLRLFEQTGQISLDRLLRLIAVVDSLDPFDAILRAPPARSLEELEQRETPRKRGRRKR